MPTNNNGSTTNRTYIGESKAKSIMLSNVPGATIRGFHFDNDSTPEYEAELIKDGYEYDISVNALTGEIIEFSKEAYRTIWWWQIWLWRWLRWRGRWGSGESTRKTTETGRSWLGGGWKRDKAQREKERDDKRILPGSSTESIRKSMKMMI